MSKTVISVRLSEERLSDLDSICSQLKTNRSQAIDMAIRLLPNLIGENSEFVYRPYWEVGKNKEK